jgi:hypothetical protein
MQVRPASVAYAADLSASGTRRAHGLNDSGPNSWNFAAHHENIKRTNNKEKAIIWVITCVPKAWPLRYRAATSPNLPAGLS